MDTIVSATKYYEHLKSLEMYELWFYKNENNQVRKYQFEKEPYYAILEKKGKNTVCDYYRVCRAEKHLKQGMVYTRHQRKNNSVVTVPSIAELAEVRVQEICGRTVKVGVEVYYLILGTLNGIVETLFAIPQTELKILAQKLGNKLSSLFADNPIFSNSIDNFTVYFAKIKKGKKDKKRKRVNEKESNQAKVKNDKKHSRKSTKQIKSGKSNTKNISSRMKWYHGTNDNMVRSSKDLKPSKGEKFGDFGKGIYLTDTFFIATEYAKTINGYINKNSKIIELVWSNDELDKIYKEIISDKNCPNKQAVPLTNGAEVFTLVVFSKKSQEWSNALLDGWNGERVPDCDMVLAPLSQSDIERIARKCINDIKRTNNNTDMIADLQKDFFQQVDTQKIKNRVVYQLCCYNVKVLKSFIEVGNK